MAFWCLVPVVISLLLAIVAVNRANSQLGLVAAILFLGSMALGLTVYLVRFFHYRCPVCKQILRSPTTSKVGTVAYLCPSCDIMWDIGIIDTHLD